MNAFLWLLTFICAAGFVSGLLFLFLPSRLHAEPIPSDQVELEKTRLEIEDLRFGWMRTLGTALLTVVVAVGGWLIQQLLAHNDLVEKEKLAIHDTYIHNLGDLGDANPTRRIAAAAYLSGAYQDISDTADKKQLIDALVYQFVSERDGLVQSYMVRQLQLMTTAQNAVLAAAADQNRRFAADYGNAAGAYVADPASGLAQRGSMTCRSFNGKSMTDFDAEVAAGSFCHFQGYFNHGAVPRNTLSPEMTLGDDFDRGFWLRFGKGDIDSEQRDLRKAWAGVWATGVLMSDLLIKGAARDGQDLHAVLLPADTDISGANLSGVNLSNATILAAAKGVQFDFADLDGADLCANTDVTGSSFRGAAVFGACIPKRAIAISDFSGANLIDAFTIGDFGDFGSRVNAADGNTMYPLYSSKIREHEFAKCKAVSAPRPCSWSLPTPRR